MVRPVLEILRYYGVWGLALGKVIEDTYGSAGILNLMVVVQMDQHIASNFIPSMYSNVLASYEVPLIFFSLTHSYFSQSPRMTHKA